MLVSDVSAVEKISPGITVGVQSEAVLVLCLLEYYLQDMSGLYLACDYNIFCFILMTGLCMFHD